MKPGKLFICIDCGEGFSGRRYPAHRRWCKKKGKAAKKGKACPICKKVISNPRAMGGHMSGHAREGKTARGPRSSRKLVRSLAAKRDSLREKGMGYLAVADKIDLMIAALKKVE